MSTHEDARGGDSPPGGARSGRQPDWQSHPAVNSDRRCPWCATRALHEQHCKQICLACGWYRSCVD